MRLYPSSNMGSMLVQQMWSYCCLVDWYYCVNFLVADGSSEGGGV